MYKWGLLTEFTTSHLINCWLFIRFTFHYLLNFPIILDNLLVCLLFIRTCILHLFFKRRGKSVKSLYGLYFVDKPWLFVFNIVLVSILIIIDMQNLWWEIFYILDLWCETKATLQNRSLSVFLSIDV